MSILTNTKLEDHPSGTTNLTGILNGNWATLERIFDPDLASDSPQFGVIFRSLAGQVDITTITYAASVNLDLKASYQVNKLALTGNVTIAATNKTAGRWRWLIISADGTNRTVTWPAGAVWGSSALTTVPAGTTAVVLVLSGSTLDAGLVLTSFKGPAYSDLGIVPKLYGGTGADNSAVTFPASGTVATTADILAAIYGLSWKAPVRFATTANGTLATAFDNGSPLDGGTIATGDRLLLKDQTAPAENGIYIANASGAPTRALDANAAGELASAAVIVMEGTANAEKLFKCENGAAFTLGTDPVVFVEQTGGGGGVTPSWEDQDMAAEVTVNDEDEACATGITGVPVGRIDVLISGRKVSLGDGAKDKECYFSGDGGTNARARGAMTTGDKLYWMGTTIALFQLTADDTVTFQYSE